MSFTHIVGGHERLKTTDIAHRRFRSLHANGAPETLAIFEQTRLPAAQMAWDHALHSTKPAPAWRYTPPTLRQAVWLVWVALAYMALPKKWTRRVTYGRRK